MKKTGWRKYLTPDERAELRQIDAELKRAKKASAKLSQKRRKIQNLASRRMAYAAKRAAVARSGDGESQ